MLTKTNFIHLKRCVAGCCLFLSISGVNISSQAIREIEKEANLLLKKNYQVDTSNWAKDTVFIWDFIKKLEFL